MADADLKVTKIVIKVDLQCSKCYKKIKKVLCRYPGEIRDQTYDVKNNKVFIAVVCCSPKCIMEKIKCKAGDTVESIEIVPDNKDPKPPSPDPTPMYPIGVCCCCYYRGGPPCYHGWGLTCYDGCGRPVSRCDEYFREENASGCSVM